MGLIKCDPRAMAKCKLKDHCCGHAADAYFTEGSDCDLFNHEVIAAQASNADRIRAMSDEELVVFIDKLTSNCLTCAKEEKNEDCPIYKEGYFCRPHDIMDWLKQPAEEADHERD